MQEKIEFLVALNDQEVYILATLTKNFTTIERSLNQEKKNNEYLEQIMDAFEYASSEDNPHGFKLSHRTRTMYENDEGEFEPSPVCFCQAIPFLFEGQKWDKELGIFTEHPI